MGKYSILLILLFSLGSIVSSSAQELLTVEEAVKIALENNYQIKTARNELTMDELGVRPVCSRK